MSQKYIYWKWGNGEGIMQKSLRKNNKNTDENSKSNKDVIQNNIINQRINNIEQNKRELNCERMSQRQMVIQTSINPFLAKNDYISDLDIQSQFLRPKDSNIKSEE